MLGRFVARLLARGLGRDAPATPPRFALYIPAGAFDELAATARATVQQALVAHNLGRYRRSATLLRAALGQAPESADVLALLGMSALELGRDAEARGCFERARRTEPRIARRYHEVGTRLYQRSHREQAIACFFIASRLDPAEAAHFAALGDVLLAGGREAEARDWFTQSVSIDPRPGFVLKKVISGLRAVYDSSAQMLEARRRYAEELERLEATPLRMQRPHLEVSCQPFFLAYMGMNDRDLQERLARIYLKASPELAYVAPHCAAGRARRPGALRVGFASAYFRRHSVGMFYNGVVRRLLERADMEVHTISFGDGLDEALQRTLAERGRHVEVPKKDLDASRRIIAGLELDVLLYADIGMQPASYFLAFSRLAPLQVCMAGHPETSGIPSLDYFLSSALMELPEADEHYSERLVRLRALPSAFPRPAPQEILGRARLGLSEERHVYVCPMRLQKMHPDFDRALAEILRRDEQAEIVLFQDHASPEWDLQVKRRFEGGFPDVYGRLNFLPWANEQEFYSVLTHADAALDTFHYGGGVTALIALATGCPFIPLPGRMMPSRQLLGCYLKMQLMDCVASDFDDYVAKVLRLGRDRPYREALRASILERNAVLYDNHEMADELAEWLLHAAAEGVPTDAKPKSASGTTGGATA